MNLMLFLCGNGYYKVENNVIQHPCTNINISGI